MKLFIEETAVSSQSFHPRDPLIIDGKRVRLGFTCIPLFTVRDRDNFNNVVKQFLSLADAQQFINNKRLEEYPRYGVRSEFAPFTDDDKRERQDEIEDNQTDFVEPRQY